jgi:hypothetical protein
LHAADGGALFLWLGRMEWKGSCCREMAHAHAPLPPDISARYPFAHPLESMFPI